MLQQVIVFFRGYPTGKYNLEELGSMRTLKKARIKKTKRSSITCVLGVISVKLDINNPT